jgi:GT2 family glycosyltransferase
LSAGCVGVVVIGRNEGERLVRCLRSARCDERPTLYVDSGSSDGSVARARELGAGVLELEPDVPFTAARARNRGVAALLAEHPQVDLLQLVDGDCELRPDWIAVAEATLRSTPDAAAVCGRRRERAPEATPYNRVTDREWDLPAGDTHTFGGDVLIRRDVFEELQGYRDDMIAGEDPELSTRILDRGYRILRLDQEMTLHDADLRSFRQWWVRQVRAGHAYAELAARTSGARGAYWRGKLRSIVAWGAGPFVFTAVAVMLAGAPGLLVLPLLYALLAFRIWRPERAAGNEGAALWTAACTIGKWPLLLGAAQYGWSRLEGGPRELIEYKGPGTPR